jgi:hypothetical protein
MRTNRAGQRGGRLLAAALINRKEAAAMFDPTMEANNSLLNTIREGMNVRDSTGDRIGTVRRVQMGGNDPVDAQEQAREAGPTDREPGVYGTTLLGDLAEAVVGNRDIMPAEVRQDLQFKGYIEIDSSGIFTPDRYATADQIAGVEADAVVLNVSADALVRA